MQHLKRSGYRERLVQLGRCAWDSPNPPALLEEVPATAVEELEAELAIVYLLEPDRLEFRVASGVGLVEGQTIGTLVPNRPDTAPGYVVAAGLPVTVSDFRSELRFKPPPAPLNAGLTSGLVVPLSDRGRILGPLVVCPRTAMRFGNE